ncbi:(2Fe-2S)-binding protein [Allohahella marinimesophila]|uniref:Bacterioferritin-associated ferredoxin n=1 Tax=Allohahella marinimesophila TaxID=1054972 RepID=A0ABP7P320_9GAMM
MYVCVCAGVTDRMIEAAVRDGTRRMKDIVETFQLGKTCATCVEMAQDIMQQSINNLDLAYDLMSQEPAQLPAYENNLQMSA